MRELCLPEDLHPGQTGQSQTGPKRSDRSRDRSDRSETSSPSYELYFDMRFDRVPTLNGYRPPHPIYMKGHSQWRVIPIDSHIYPLLFISKP